MSQHDILGAVQISATSYDSNNPYHTESSYESEGETITVYTDTRFHVNALEPIEGADAHIISPNPHSRVFAGVPLEAHIFYRFDDEAQFREFVPAPNEE